MEHHADAAWRRRYTAAARALESMRVVVAQERAVERSRPDGPSRADVRMGGARLRAARHAGLFAGSFNPLTTAHVDIAAAARAAGGLDCVVWTCAVHTVDKERVERASVADRLAQLVAYARGLTGDAVALVNRGLYVEQAEALRRRLQPGAELSIIVGIDKALQIFDPHYYANREAALRELFALARLLVSPRAGAGEAALAELLARPENRPYARYVTYVPVPAAHTEDSSSQARALLASVSASLDPGAVSRELRELVAPEGLALALVTGAYESSARYAERLRRIHELAQRPETPPQRTQSSRRVQEAKRG